MKGKRLTTPLIFCLLPVAVFLQSTLLSQALPGGITLSLCFLLVVGAGYYLGAAGGACCGMWGGALMGAAAGALAAPFALLYGAVGWLAGEHMERRPSIWTLPLVSLALFALFISAESWLGLFLEGRQPSISWKVMSLGWTGLAGLVFLGLPGLRKRC
jgi:hypothetical protein